MKRRGEQNKEPVLRSSLFGYRKSDVHDLLTSQAMSLGEADFKLHQAEAALRSLRPALLPTDLEFLEAAPMTPTELNGTTAPLSTSHLNRHLRCRPLRIARGK